MFESKNQAKNHARDWKRIDVSPKDKSIALKDKKPFGIVISYTKNGKQRYYCVPLFGFCKDDKVYFPYEEKPFVAIDESRVDIYMKYLKICCGKGINDGFMIRYAEDSDGPNIRFEFRLGKFVALLSIDGHDHQLADAGDRDWTTFNYDKQEWKNKNG